jgi:hypothetical protein
MWNPRVKAICARAHGTGFTKTIAVSALSVAIMTSRAWPRHRPAASPAWGDVCLTSGGGESPPMLLPRRICQQGTAAESTYDLTSGGQGTPGSIYSAMRQTFITQTAGAAARISRSAAGTTSAMTAPFYRGPYRRRPNSVGRRRRGRTTRVRFPASQLHPRGVRTRPTLLLSVVCRERTTGGCLSSEVLVAAA